MTTKDYALNVTKYRKYFSKKLHLPAKLKWRASNCCDTSASQDVPRGTGEGGCRSLALNSFRDILNAHTLPT